MRAGIFLRKVGDVHAVDGVSFTLARGRTLGLVGESGCGKTTVGRTILNLVPATSGTVRFESRNLSELSRQEWRDVRRDMQIVFQDPMESLNARHTVGQILEEPFVIHKIGTPTDRRERVARLLEHVGLQPSAASRFPHEFSGGQRQRIGIARAIALEPKLIICDEAVSALDVSIRAQIVNLLLELQREMDLAMLFIAHDLSVVRHVSDEVPAFRVQRKVGRSGNRSSFDAASRELGRIETFGRNWSPPFSGRSGKTRIPPEVGAIEALPAAGFTAGSSVSAAPAGITPDDDCAPRGLRSDRHG